MDNGTATKKNLQTTIVCIVCYFINWGLTSIYSPNIPRFMSEMNVSATAVSLGPLLAGATSIIFSIVASRLINKITPKWTLALASVVAIISGIVHFYVSNIGMLYFGSVLNGMVTALGTNAVVSSVMESIHGKNFLGATSLVFGIGLFGSTVGVALAGVCQATLGWRYTYLFYLCIGGALGLVFNLLLLPAAKKTTSATKNQEKSQDQTEVVSGLTSAEATKTKAFYVMFLACFCVASLYSCISMFASSYWQSHGMSETTATFNLTLLTIFSALITMGAGTVVNKLGTKKFLMILCFGFVIGMALMILWSKVQIAWMPILALAFSALARLGTMVPTMVVPAMFGRREFGAISAALMPASFGGGLIASFALGALSDLTGTYASCFIFGIVMAVAAYIFLNIAMKITPYKGEQASSEVAE